MHRRSIKDYIRSLLMLSGPIIVARIGIIALVFVDFFMVGRFNSQELAYQSVAFTQIEFVLLVTMGLLQGTSVIVAQSFGRKNYALCGRILRVSILYSILIGVITLIVCSPSEAIFLFLGQSAELSRYGGQVFFVHALSVPFALIQIPILGFLEGIKRPVPAMILVILANIVNLAGNEVLVYGHFGLPQMGAVGSAYATWLTRLFITIGSFVYLVNMKNVRLFDLFSQEKLDPVTWKKCLHIGYGTSVTMGVEAFSFAALGVFAGWLSGNFNNNDYIASYTIAINYVSLVFMVAIGVGGASGILAAHAFGRHEIDESIRIGRIGLAFSSAVMVCLSLITFFAATPIVSFFSKDPEIISMSASLLRIATLFFVFDGGQGVLTHVLRGCLDVKIPTFLQGFSYVFVLTPAAYYFAFNMDMRGEGLMIGVIVGSVCSSSLLFLRSVFYFRKLRRQAERERGLRQG